MGWDFGYALQMAERLREFGLSWIEEPLMPEQTDRYAELRQRIPWQRWSCGEHSYTKWDFAELIAKRATDILQPDLNRAGGLTEGRKIAALAETAGLPVIPPTRTRGAQPGPRLQPVPARVPGGRVLPRCRAGHGERAVLEELHEGNPSAERGEIRPPDGPGLGVSLRADVAASLLTEDGTWHRQRRTKGGSVSHEKS